MATKKGEAASADALKKRAQAAQAAEADVAAHQYQQGWKPPKSLGAAADALFKKREERLKLQKQVDQLEAEEGDLKHYLITQLPSADANGIAGKLCRVSLKKSDVPKVDDWPTFYSGIVANYQTHLKKKTGLHDGAFAVLGRAVGKTGVAELWEAGKTVPGVGKFTVTTLSINKL